MEFPTPEGAGGNVTVIAPKISSKPVEQTPVQTVTPPVQEPVQQVNTPAPIQDPVQQQIVDPVVAKPIQDPISSQIEESKLNYEPPTYTNTVNPDMRSRVMPTGSSVDFEIDPVLGISVPVLKKVPIVKDEERVDIPLIDAGAPLTKEKLEMGYPTEQKLNQDYFRSLDDYIAKGGTVNMERLTPSYKKKLLDESDKKTPSTFLEYQEPVTINKPASQVIGNIKKSVESVTSKLNTDAEALKKLGTEFENINSSYTNAQKDIQERVSKSEEFQRFNQTKASVDKIKAIEEQIKPLYEKIKDLPEKHEVAKMHEESDDAARQYKLREKKLNSLVEKLNSGAGTREDEAEYKSLKAEYESKYQEYTKSFNRYVASIKKLESNKDILKGDELWNLLPQKEELDKIYTEHNEAINKLNEKYKSEFDARKGELDTRLSKAKSDYDAVFPESVFSKAKEEWLKDNREAIKAEYNALHPEEKEKIKEEEYIDSKYKGGASQYIESNLLNEMNSKRFNSLIENGIVGDIRRDLPESVQRFIESNTYLNSSAKEKRYYLNNLFEQYESELPKDIKESVNPRASFFTAVSPTLIPKIDAVFSKSMAQELLNQVGEVKAKIDRSLKAYYEQGDNTNPPPSVLEENNKLAATRKILESVVNADYDNESSNWKGFLKSWDTSKAVGFASGIEELANALGLKKIANYVAPNGKFDKTRYEKLNEVDKLLYKAHGIANSYNSITTPNTGSKMAEIAERSLAFMQEMGITRAPSEALTSEIITGAKAIGAQFTRWTPSATKGFTEVANILAKNISPPVAMNVGKITRKATELAMQTNISASQHIATSIAKDLTPQNQEYFSASSNKFIQDANEAAEGSVFEAALKGYWRNFVEVSTEHISDIKLFGMSGLGGKFFDKTKEFTEDEFKLLSRSSHLPEATLRSLRQTLQNSKASEYMSRLIMSKVAQKTGDLISFNPNTYSKAALKDLFKATSIGNPLTEIFEEVVADWTQPGNNDDLRLKYPVSMGYHEIKEAVIGLAPLLVAGKALDIAGKVTNRAFGERGGVSDFNEVVKNMSTEDFNSKIQSLYDKANSFSSPGAKSSAEKIISQRQKFDAGTIEGVPQGLTYKEYLDLKESSANTYVDVMNALRKNDQQEAQNLIQQGITLAPDTETADQFAYIQKRIDTNDPNGSHSLYQHVASGLKEYNNVFNKIQSFTLDSLGYNPSKLKSEIDSLDITDSMRKPLLDAYEKLDNSYKENLSKFGIKEITNEAPDSITVSGFDNNSVTFTRDNSGKYTVSGVNDSQKDSSAIATGLEKMDTTALRALFHAVNNSNADDTFKQEVSKEAVNTLADRIENLNAVVNPNIDELVNTVSSLNQMAEQYPIDNDNKTSLSASIKRAFNGYIKLHDTPEELKEIQSAAFNLSESVNVVDLDVVSDINSSIGRRLLRNSLKEGMTKEELEVVDNQLELSEEPIEQVGEDTSSKGLQQKLKQIKLGATKSWKKALEKSVNKANLKKVEISLNQLVKSGHITEKGKNLITSSIMNTGWMQKLLSLDKVVTVTEPRKVSSPDNFKGTYYDPASRTVVIQVGYQLVNSKGEKVGEPVIATESQNLKEIMQELIHNAHQMMLIGITGNSSTIQLNEDEIEEITRSSKSPVLKSIVDFYRSFNYKYNDFLEIQNKSLDERTPDERKEYDSIMDYLRYVSNNFTDGRSDLMNLSFKDTYSKKVFDTKKLVENYRRFKIYHDLGYDTAQSFYYSKDYREFFAETFGSLAIEQEVKSLEKPALTSIIDNTRKWFSDAVNLPAVTRFLKSERILDIDKGDIMSSMSQYEIDKILKVQSSITEFYNEEQEQIFKNVSPIMKGILFKDAEGDVLLELKRILDDQNFDKLDTVFTKFYTATSKKYGDEAAFIYLEHILKDINISNSRLSIDARTMYDYIVDKFSGDYTGDFESYFDSTDNALNSIRGFGVGKMTREERQKHDQVLTELMTTNATPDEVFKKYGIYLDKDFKLKQWIKPDVQLIENKGKVEGRYLSAPLYKVLDFPELYRIYPEARLLNVRVPMKESLDAGAYYDSSIRSIVIDRDFVTQNTDEGNIKVLLHEIQHFIQHKEGFGFGTMLNSVPNPKNLENIFRALKNIQSPEYSNLLFSLLKRYVDPNKAQLDIYSILENKESITAKYKSYNQDDVQPVWNRILSIVNYHLHLGEVEARLAESLAGVYLNNKSAIETQDILNHKDVILGDEIVYTPYKVYDERFALGSMRSNEPVTYKSNTLKAVEDTKLSKASGPQWLTQILSRGANKAEIERYGLDEFLQLNKSATKADILEFLSDKVMKVKDVVLGGGEVNEQFSLLNANFEDIKNNLKSNYNLDYDDYEPFLNIGAELNENGLSEYLDFKKSKDEINYNKNNFDSISYWIKEMRRINKELLNYNEGEKETHWSEYTAFPLNNYRELLPVIDTEQKLFSQESHFSGIKNQLYHNRLNDVTTESGKNLLLSEEMQADWTQGKGTTVFSQEIYNLNKERRELLNELSNITDKNIAERENDNERYDFINERIKSIDKEIDLIDKKNNPNSPYTKTSDWVRAAIKRMIKMAVDEGKDGIAWTPAHIQVERWSGATRAVVDKISWEYKSGTKSKYPDGHIFVSAFKNGEHKVSYSFNKLVDGTYEDNDGNKISDVFGSEIEKKITSNYTGGELNDEQIIVGGQGYIDIYDKTAVDVANKLGKKYGVEVTQEEVKTKNEGRDTLDVETGGKVDKSRTVKVHTLLLTPEMKEDIAKTNELTLFSKRAVSRRDTTPSSFKLEVITHDSDGKEYGINSNVLSDEEIRMISATPDMVQAYRDYVASTLTDKTKVERYILPAIYQAIKNIVQTPNQDIDRQRLRDFARKIYDSTDNISVVFEPDVTPYNVSSDSETEPDFGMTKREVKPTIYEIESDYTDAEVGEERGYIGAKRYRNVIGKTYNTSAVASPDDIRSMFSFGLDGLMSDAIDSVIIRGDANEVVKYIPDLLKFDSVILDPPYPIGGSIGTAIKRKWSKKGIMSRPFITYNEFDDMVSEIKGHLSNEDSIVSLIISTSSSQEKNRFTYEEIMQVHGFKQVGANFILKKDKEGNIPKQRMNSEHDTPAEVVMYWNLSGREFKSKKDVDQYAYKQTGYATGKPSETTDEIIKGIIDYLNEGDQSNTTGFMLDPFQGGGNFVVSAAKMGYKTISIDQSLDSVELTQSRLSNLGGAYGTHVALDIGAKRGFVLDHTAFTTLIANSKNGRTVTKQELFNELKQIEININKFSEPQKRNASLEANQLVKMWKVQYLKNEMPKISKSRLSEIVRLLDVPVRAKIADYTKDVAFIEKYVSDTSFRGAYEQAKNAIATARKRYAVNYRKNVDFYVALSKALKVSLNMFDSPAELKAFANFLTENHNTTDIAYFERTAQKYYDDYIEWRESPEEKNQQATSLAQQQVDDTTRRYISFVKVRNSGVTYSDPFIQRILDIDQDGLSGTELKEYSSYVNYVVHNNRMTSGMYNFAQRYYANKAAERILGDMDEFYVHMLNEKTVGNSVKEWFKGSIFGAAFNENNLGNLSHFDVSTLLKFMSTELEAEMVKPLVESKEVLQGLVRDIMNPLIPDSWNITQEDSVIIGIYGLLSQNPQIKLGAKSALELNQKFNVDIYKQGMILDKNSLPEFQQGYQDIRSKINDGLANSIAFSYGEDVEGMTAIQSLKAKEIVAERRGISVSELEKERDKVLKATGYNSILDLSKDIASGVFIPNQNSLDWLGEIRKVFENIKNGDYTNGVTLESASVVRSADEFVYIDDYFPILRYNESEKYTEFEADNANEIFYGYSKDFYMNEGFLERRKNVLMALNPNAWEAAGRRIDQQLFYLLNIDHKKFLGKFFATDFFDGKEENSLSKKQSSYIREMFNMIFNRGVSRSQIAMANANDTALKAVNETIQNIKPFYIGATGNAPAQLSTVLTSMGAMKGNPVLRVKNMFQGIVYSNPFDGGYDHPMNVLLREHAKEVYYRGLADYQIPMAEGGVIVRSSLSGLSKGVYTRSEDSSYLDNFIEAVRNKDFRTAVQIGALLFFDRYAARMSFYALYNNYMDNAGLEVDYERPNLQAVQFALEGVRKTQHTSSDIFQAGISKNIVAGEDNMDSGKAAAWGDMLLSSILAFKTFSMNQKKFLQINGHELRRNIIDGNIYEAQENIQAIAYAMTGTILFHLMKTSVNLLMYGTPIALAFSGGDWDKFKGRLSITTEGYFNIQNLLVQSFLDQFVIAETPARLTASVIELLEEKAKGVEKLEAWERRGYPYGETSIGGFVVDALTQSTVLTQKVITDAQEKTLHESYPDIGQLTLLLSTAIFGTIPTGADMNKLLIEIRKNEKLEPGIQFNESVKKTLTKKPISKTNTVKNDNL